MITDIILILIVFVAVILVSKYSTLGRKVFIAVFALTILMLLLHLLLGNSKWQLYPLYVVLPITMLYLVGIKKAIGIKRPIRVGIITLMFVMIVLSIVSSIVFPVYQLPVPTGNYDIGTASFIIEDTTRLEQYDEDRTYRTIKIQLWYPAETTEGYEKVPWLEDGIEVARALSIDTGLPAFVLDHTAKILSNSYYQAPLSTDKENYPVVVISHGWRGFRNLHTDFAEELASQGYIAVSIDHTYGTVATKLDDGFAYLNLDALPERETVDNFLAYANELVYTYAGDITTTLSYLEEINGSSTSRFQSKLDLSKIGLVGHSTGGGAGAAVALEDDRIDAIFGLDSWVESIDETIILNGLSMDALFVRSGAWEISYNNDRLYQLNNSSATSILYQIDGTTHFDFSMVYMYSPLTKAIGFTGEVEGRYLNSILTTMMVEFFDDTLIEETTSSLDISEWEEVRVIPTD